jgi:hypothetical protein
MHRADFYFYLLILSRFIFFILFYFLKSGVSPGPAPDLAAFDADFPSEFKTDIAFPPLPVDEFIPFTDDPAPTFTPEPAAVVAPPLPSREKAPLPPVDHSKHIGSPAALSPPISKPHDIISSTNMLNSQYLNFDFELPLVTSSPDPPGPPPPSSTFSHVSPASPSSSLLTSLPVREAPPPPLPPADKDEDSDDSDDDTSSSSSSSSSSSGAHESAPELPPPSPILTNSSNPDASRPPPLSLHSDSTSSSSASSAAPLPSVTRSFTVASPREEGEGGEDSKMRSLRFEDSEWNIPVNFCYPSIRAISSDFTKEQKKLSREHEKKMDGVFEKKEAAMSRVFKWGEAREGECVKAFKSDLEKLEKENSSLLHKLISQQKQEKSQFTSTQASSRKAQEKARNEEIKAWSSKRKQDADEMILQSKVDHKGDKATQKQKKAELTSVMKLDVQQHTELQQLLLKHDLEASANEKEREFFLTQNSAKKELVMKSMQSKQELELAHLDALFIVQVQNNQKAELCRSACVELFRPVVFQLAEEKKALDFQTLERAQQTEIADLKKKFALARKQMAVDLAARKKSMQAEHKQNLKAIKKGGKEQKNAEKARFEKEVQNVEETMERECAENEKQQEASLLEEHKRKLSTLEDNWRQQLSRLEGKLSDLSRLRHVPTYRYEFFCPSTCDEVNSHIFTIYLIAPRKIRRIWENLLSDIVKKVCLFMTYHKINFKRSYFQFIWRVLSLICCLPFVGISLLGSYHAERLENLKKSLADRTSLYRLLFIDTELDLFFCIF